MGGRRSGRPLVLGHRGYRARFPENTILSFRQALEAGADGVECDLQKTADGRYVVLHDATIDRVTGVPGSVGSMSLSELRAYDFGMGERIPELSDLLAALPPEAYLDLELKGETITAADCEPVLRILGDRRDSRRLMISSFEPALLRPFRARGCVTGLLVGNQMAAKGVRAFLAHLMDLRPQYVNLPIEMYRVLGPRRGRLLVRVLRLLGFSLLWWTINDPAQAVSVASSAGIIVTDEVEAILRALDHP